MTPITSKTIALLRGLFAVDAKGRTFLRMCADAPEGDLENAVSRTANRSLETLLNNAVVLDEDGNPALRITEVAYGGTVAERERQRRVEAAELQARRKQEVDRVQSELNTGPVTETTDDVEIVDPT